MITPEWQVLEWFRVDQSRRTRWRLAVSAVLVASGASLAGAHLVHRLGTSTQLPLSLVGAALTLTGLVIGFGSMALLMFEDSYVGVCREGIVVHHNDHEERVAWSELHRCEALGEDLIVHRHADAPVSWRAGPAAQRIATELEQRKAKGLLGILYRGR